MTDPFMKSLGGKRKLLDQILPLLPEKISTYYEPFVGGGAVFFALAEEKRFEHAVLNDANADIAMSWAAVQKQPDRLIELLREHQVEYDKDKETYFYEVRDQDDFECKTRLAARFLFLNRSCFNGLTRYNGSGKFNAPIGDYKNLDVVREETIREAHKILSAPCRVDGKSPSVFVSQGDFVEASAVAKIGDAAYFDPPYVPVSKTSNFTGYQGEGFGEKDQIKLRDHALMLKRRGVFVLLSNSSADLVYELYKAPDFKILEILASRAINSKGDKRGKIRELLIL